MATSELVFLPAPGMGHLVPTLEFAKRLLSRHAHISITVLSMNFTFSPSAGADTYRKSLVGAETRIKFIDLPLVDWPHPVLAKSPEYCFYEANEAVVPHVREALRGIVLSSAKVIGLVLDFFGMPMVDVANEFGLPSYMFMTSNLGFLGLMLHLPSRHERVSSEFGESDPDSTLPGFKNPVPAAVLPVGVIDKDGYVAHIKLAQRFRETKGIIVNSFEELEHYSLNSLASDDQTPPIYMVGPVIDLSGRPNPSLDHAQRDRIMGWLEKQPRSSVAFLCFGSMGSFGAPQLREIAKGIERSGHRFLWCVRAPKEESLEEILPEGFIERVGERGMVCEGWAPQVEVLSQSSVGGFVSHCGWNSVLESLWHGVPIATWPMYAEQQLNAFRMVREFGLAVEMSLDYRSCGEGVVTADEIDLAVRSLMESESEVRKKVKEMSEMARKCLAEGGSSFAAVGQFINDILGSN